MPIYRHFVRFVMVAVLLVACSASDLPDYAPTRDADLQEVDWPAFLPVAQILSADIDRHDRANADIRSLRARAARLRQRARLLRRPVIEAYERLQMQNAAKRVLP